MQRIFLDTNIVIDFLAERENLLSTLASNCELIVTRNERDYKNPLIPVMNAESYLQTFKINNGK